MTVTVQCIATVTGMVLCKWRVVFAYFFFSNIKLFSMRSIVRYCYCFSIGVFKNQRRITFVLVMLCKIFKYKTKEKGKLWRCSEHYTSAPISFPAEVGEAAGKPRLLGQVSLVRLLLVVTVITNVVAYLVWFTLSNYVAEATENVVVVSTRVPSSIVIVIITSYCLVARY